MGGDEAEGMGDRFAEILQRLSGRQLQFPSDALPAARARAWQPHAKGEQRWFRREALARHRSRSSAATTECGSGRPGTSAACVRGPRPQRQYTQPSPTGYVETMLLPGPRCRMVGQPKASRRDELFLSSREQRLPADNFYRQLEAKLDLSFVRDWVADKYAEGGRPSIDPVVFFKLELILFFEGLRSERKLMETADLNLAHRWYLGFGFEEPLPVVLDDGTQYLYGAEGLAEQLQINNFALYFLPDVLGSTLAVMASDGSVQETYQYDAYGAVAGTAVNNRLTEYQFAGQDTDPSGLQYLRARYYDRSMGRFLSRDSWTPSVTNPAEHHPYVYADDNPARGIDPTGQDVCPTIVSPVGPPTNVGICQRVGPAGVGAGGGVILVLLMVVISRVDDSISNILFAKGVGQ